MYILKNRVLFDYELLYVKDGKVIITWDPDLNENGTKQVRDYRTFGRKRLDDEEDWVDMQTVPEAEKGDYRFYKVTVEMSGCRPSSEQ